MEKNMAKIEELNRRFFFKIIFCAALAPRIQAGQRKTSQVMPAKNQLIQNKDNDILVLYYSMSGNTEIMAKKIASRYQADLVKIIADDYSNDLVGSTRANNDAWIEKKECTIAPEIFDMSRYRYIFLGSPIWWYRPAVPLWTLVGKNRFHRQNIVLFNTFNSRFKDNYISEFSNLIKTNGGKLIDHVYVRRGRWYNQLDQNELIEQIQKRLEINEMKWGFGIKQSA